MFTKLTSVHAELANVTSSSTQIQLLHCRSGKWSRAGLKTTWAVSRGHRDRLERWALWAEIVDCAAHTLFTCSARQTWLLKCRAETMNRMVKGNLVFSQFHSRLTDITLHFSQLNIKGLDTCYTAAYMSQTHDQRRFTISEVAADWHEPMVPQRIM